MDEAINVKTQVLMNPDLNPVRPLPYHLRTGHYLPVEDSLVSQQVQNLVRYAEEHEMRINTNKTKMMLFNPSRTVDIQPEIVINDTEIDLIEKSKLLGVMITSDLKWKENTDYITGRCYSRLWIIKRLKQLNCPAQELVDTYVKQVRSILEMACPVWHPSLTKADCKELERVQKSALAIILGSSYSSYNSALDFLDLESLEDRRDRLCLNFALKCESDPKHSKWFLKSADGPSTRNKVTYKPVWTRTDRFRDSPIPYMTNLLNEYHKKKK